MPTTFFRAANKENTGNRNPYLNRNAGASTSQENTGEERPYLPSPYLISQSSKVKKSKKRRIEVPSDEDSDDSSEILILYDSSELS